MTKRALILVGFGRPPSMAEVTSFLYEIFSDPVASPFSRLGLLMKPVARLVATLAAGRARKRYLSIADKPDSLNMIGDLALRLERRISDSGTKVVAAMRYGEPSIGRVAEDLIRSGFDGADVIPLFPQRARSTWGTIEAAFENLPFKARMAKSWHAEPAFARAWAGSIMRTVSELASGESEDIHVVFSAHAIPVYHQEFFGDKYTDEVEASARLIREKLGGDFSASVAYQSRTPFGRWTGPSLESELLRLGAEGRRGVIIAPISFIYENIETWCDLDLDIIPNSAKFGLEKIGRAAVPIESSGIVEALANRVCI